MFRFETTRVCMVKLAIVSDDLTGAFDTSVQFAKKGAATKVVIGESLPDDVDGVDVLVIDAETRHLPDTAAYDKICSVVRWIIARRIPHLYIKTDSGLRGNVGATMKAVMDTMQPSHIAFAPAYPGMNRVTLNGVHWIDGTLLADSVFGHDMFNPVTVSRIKDMIEPYGLNVSEIPIGGTVPTDDQSVLIFDAASDEDLSSIAGQLSRLNLLKVTAGCAGFASALTEYFDLSSDAHSQLYITKPYMVVCGSLSPVSRQQLHESETDGAKRITMSFEQLTDADYFDTPRGREFFDSLVQELTGSRSLLIDTCPPPDDIVGNPAALKQSSSQIANQLGRLFDMLLHTKEAEQYTPMVIGGDTLMGFLSRQKQLNLTLLGEAAMGVVAFSMDGYPDFILSKSGGFGAPTLLRDMISVKETAR